jgi:hypothetical protein
MILNNDIDIVFDVCKKPVFKIHINDDLWYNDIKKNEEALLSYIDNKFMCNDTGKAGWQVLRDKLPIIRYYNSTDSTLLVWVQPMTPETQLYCGLLL